MTAFCNFCCSGLLMQSPINSSLFPFSLDSSSYRDPTVILEIQAKNRKKRQSSYEITLTFLFLTLLKCHLLIPVVKMLLVKHFTAKT